MEADELFESTTSSRLKVIDILKGQQEDPTIKRVLQFCKLCQKPKVTDQRREPPQVRKFLNKWKHLHIDKKTGLLYHNQQLVLPQKFKRLVYRELHEEMGHLGVERVLALARERFFWLNMRKDIEHFVQRTCRCIKQKQPSRHTVAPLNPIVTTAPFQMISIDFMHLEQSSGGYQYILVVVDHFTKFAQTYPTRNKKGKTVADIIFNDFVQRFGFPEKIHHDMGGEFENELFKRLEQLSGVMHSRTTPYHPQGNGLVERMNRTLLGMLRTLPEAYKSRWKDHLSKLTHAYNCTVHESTNYFPFYLLFGRSPRLPIDLIFDLPRTSDTTSHSDYASKWETAMQQVYTLAHKATSKNAANGGPGKLRAYWEEAVHVVELRKGSDSPVYEVKPESGHGRNRTLHRNLLLPCDFLPIENWPEIERTVIKRVPPRSPISKPGNEETDEEESVDESEDEIRITWNTDQINNAAAADGDFVGEPNPDIAVDEADGGDATDESWADDENHEITGDEQAIENSTDDAQEEVRDVRSQRNRQPPQRLTYLDPGNPAYLRPICSEVVNQFYPMSSHVPPMPLYLPPIPPIPPYLPPPMTPYLPPMPPVVPTPSEVQPFGSVPLKWLPIPCHPYTCPPVMPLNWQNPPFPYPIQSY
ncbi:Retrovirus-related Pol poly from transposon 412 [Paramuricea clavata]|uniref:Retrovirus-related Pol poly from transposon 412, partial n=1 Tax=Paramuricea clavata TaxID=317549 RepID=A0A7D9IRP8_PARCT|nr:Retrovirus-related Pol poly from transposon 412 [Paramuricea clavata]